MSATDTVLIEVPEEVRTERLLLAVPRAGLGPLMYEAVAESMDRIKPWLPWAQEQPSLEDCEARLRRMYARFILREDLPYLIFDGEREGRRLLGGAGLHRMDWGVRRFEIGYWVRSSAEGKGYVAETVNALAEMCFQRLSARRVDIRVDVSNARSRAVAERCGFALESIVRNESLSAAGQPRDMCVYVRLA
jgi:RimJ/RimL family protein N-acetyltransferase